MFARACGGHASTQVVVIMFLFSISVQMAEGLTYGIVPFVSRPALGVVSGMVGAGGNAGAVLTNAAFFVSDSVRTDTGLINMGIMIVVATLSLFVVYFPDQGGMLVKAGGWAYDPQRIKPPAGYKGSDEITLDFHKPDQPTPQAATAQANVIEATPATVTQTNESKDASNKI